MSEVKEFGKIGRLNKASDTLLKAYVDPKKDAKHRGEE